MVYLQNGRAQLTGEDCLAAPNGPKTYTSLTIGTARSTFADFRYIYIEIIYKTFVRTNVYMYDQGNQRQKCIGYSGHLPHCPAKRRTATKQKKKKVQQLLKATFHLQLNEKGMSCLPLLSTLRCGGESPQQIFQQPSNENELEKPQEQHLSDKDVGNAFTVDIYD